MIIEELSEKNEFDWDSFVLSHPEGTIYHQIGWKKLIQKTFNHIPQYFVCRQGDKIVGVLPLFKVHSILNKKFVSIPYCPYGGVLASNEEAKNLLLNRIITLAKDQNVGYVELRERKDLNYGLSKSENHVSFILKLSEDYDSLWSSFNSSTRRHIRKAEKLEYEIKINKNIDTFYNLYAYHMRNIGTPTLGFKFFKNLSKLLDKSFNIATIYYNNKPVSSVLLLYFKDIAVYDRGASSYEYKELNLNYVLFWKIICNLSKQNYTWFDFGRSVPESGTYQFKNGWRPEIIKLQYQYYLNSIKLVPNISQNSTKRKMFAKIWRQLPLGLTDQIGGYLRKLSP